LDLVRRLLVKKRYRLFSKADAKFATWIEICGVRAEMHLSRAAASLGNDNVKIDIMAFDMPLDWFIETILADANCKSRSSRFRCLCTSARRELRCPALSIAVASFNLPLALAD